jgi:peptidoglycan hydrolase-like protein with peptidoglycan-binding domain
MFLRLRRAVHLSAISAALLFSSANSLFAVEGPSFDCSSGVRQTLAVILCTVPEAAQADWNLNSAYWALFSDDREETTFNMAVNQRCALPPLETEQQRAGRVFIQDLRRRMGTGLPIPNIPSPQPLTEQHVRCVFNAFNTRAAALRDRLRGDALVESKLSPEEHIDVQVALDRKGFLRNRERRYGSNPDGQFGPNTRAAIRDFQRSINAEPTGFLSNEQRLTLLECPEERAAREAAREKARQDAIEAKRLAEQKAEEDAEARERKHLEDLAAKAAELRRKIEDAQKKGTEYADKEVDLNWSISERFNPMTDQTEYSVSSTQKNSGVLALTEGQCQKNQIVFEATLHDAKDPDTPLGIPGSTPGGIVGNKRINDDTAFATTFLNDKFRNRVILARLSFQDDATEQADTIWRILAEIETAKGTMIIKIPTFDKNNQKLIAACKRQYEIEKIRQYPALPSISNPKF